MKMIRRIALALAIIVFAFIMTGCYGVRTDLSMNGDGKITYMEMRTGMSTSIMNREKGFSIDDKDYVQQNYRNFVDSMGVTDGIFFNKFGASSYMLYRSLITEQADGTTIRYGKGGIAGLPYGGPLYSAGHYDENGNVVLDVIINIEMFSGFKPQDIWQSDDSIKNSWWGQQAYEEYMAAKTDIEREEVLDKWMLQWVINMDMPANVSVLQGEKYVKINGKQVTVNVGQMLRDDGGKVQLFSCMLNEDGKVDTSTHPDVLVYKDLRMRFDDMYEGAWYLPAVQYAVDNGIMQGNGSSVFLPDMNVHFSELAQILYNVGHKNGDAYDNIGVAHWSSEAVGWALQRGMIDKDAITINDAITKESIEAIASREQAIAALSRLAIYMGRMPDDAKEPNIPDLLDISSQYRDDIKMAYCLGISSGIDATGRFEPNSYFTRAQVCQVFYNMKM